MKESDPIEMIKPDLKEGPKEDANAHEKDSGPMAKESAPIKPISPKMGEMKTFDEDMVEERSADFPKDSDMGKLGYVK